MAGFATLPVSPLHISRSRLDGLFPPSASDGGQPRCLTLPQPSLRPPGKTVSHDLCASPLSPHRIATLSVVTRVLPWTATAARALLHHYMVTEVGLRSYLTRTHDWNMQSAEYFLSAMSRKGNPSKNLPTNLTKSYAHGRGEGLFFRKANRRKAHT